MFEIAKDQAVTFGLIGFLISVGGAAFAVLKWMDGRYMTKAAVKAMADLYEARFKKIEEASEGLHLHIREVRQEMRDEIKSVDSRLDLTNKTLMEVASNVSWLRGRLEPGAPPRLGS